MKTIRLAWVSVALVCALVSGNAGAAESATLAEDPAVPQLQQLLQQKREVASEALRLASSSCDAGNATMRDVMLAQCQLLEARLELCTTPAQRNVVLTARLDMLKRIEQDAQRRFEAGVVPKVMTDEARCDRIEAQIALLRLQSAGLQNNLAGDEHLRTLLADWVEGAHTILRITKARWEGGTTTTRDYCAAGRRVRQAELEQSVTREQQLSARSNFLAWTRGLERTVLRRVDIGTLPMMEGALPASWRCAAEIDWLRASGATNEAFHRLLREHCDQATRACNSQLRSLEAGRGTIGDVCEAVAQLRHAELDLAVTPEEKLAAHTNCVDRLGQLEEAAKRRISIGVTIPSSLLFAQMDRLDAEIELLKARTPPTRTSGNPSELPKKNSQK